MFDPFDDGRAAARDGEPYSTGGWRSSAPRLAFVHGWATERRRMADWWWNDWEALIRANEARSAAIRGSQEAQDGRNDVPMGDCTP